MYHLVKEGQTEALCGQYDEEKDQLVPEAEARDPNGRHFNCPNCDYVLHDGKRHVESPQ
jgi:hypothetical protein